MHRNKDAEITPGPFQTPDYRERATGAYCLYSHFESPRGGGMCSPAQPKGIIWVRWANTDMESVSCCVEDWAQAGLAHRRCSCGYKKCGILKMTSFSYLSSFSLNLTTDKLQLVGLGIIKHVISMRIGLMTHFSLCPQGKPYAWNIIAAA